MAGTRGPESALCTSTLTRLNWDCPLSPPPMSSVGLPWESACRGSGSGGCKTALRAPSEARRTCEQAYVPCSAPSGACSWERGSRAGGNRSEEQLLLGVFHFPAEPGREDPPAPPRSPPPAAADFPARRPTLTHRGARAEAPPLLGAVDVARTPAAPPQPSRAKAGGSSRLRSSRKRDALC